ncbi:hypothetical protein ACFL3Y_02015 [Pseudomonadota bacterium]
MVIRSISMRYLPVCRTIQINGKQHYLWRHPVSANHYRDLRVSAFIEWSRAVA